MREGVSKEIENGTYPKAPVPVVMINTRVLLEFSNSWRVCSLCETALAPSILPNLIFFACRCFAIRSKVFVQQENTMLEYELANTQFVLANHKMPASLYHSIHQEYHGSKLSFYLILPSVRTRRNFRDWVPADLCEWKNLSKQARIWDTVRAQCHGFRLRPEIQFLNSRHRVYGRSC